MLWACHTAATPALAGPNEFGSLIIHSLPSVQYTTDSFDYCSAAANYAPEGTDVQRIGSGTTLLYVAAAFPSDSSPSLVGATFGIEYDTTLVQIFAFGRCAEFDITSADWPGSGSGTTVTWSATITSHYQPIYWLAAYTYSNEPTTLRVRTHPQINRAEFADASIPAQIDQVSHLGFFGFNTMGHLPFVEGTAIYGQEYVSVLVSPGTIAQSEDDWTYRHPASLSFSDPLLRDAVYTLGCTAARKAFPGSSPSDVNATNLNGDPVTLLPLDEFYRFIFDDSLHASVAAQSLSSMPGVLLAEAVVSHPIVHGDPEPVDDEFFNHWPGAVVGGIPVEDMQWPLKNDGMRGDTALSNCQNATSGSDLRVSNLAYWSGSQGTDQAVIAIFDIGILNSHEDLNVVAEIGREDISLYDWCGTHGTKMAGLAAARTRNGIGIAGVCPRCKLVDAKIPDCNGSLCEDPAQECQGTMANWGDYVYQLLLMTLPGTPVAINASFGTPGNTEDAATISALWNAYQRGVVTVASSGNQAWASQGVNSPSGVPFVVAAGGSTWAGDFWQPTANCTPADPPNSKGTSLGPENVDVCAPASGWALSALPYIHPVNSEWGYYSDSTVQTSGAAAHISGAVGLLQSLHFDTFQSWMDGDEVSGLLEGTALDFANDPTTMSPKCPPSECPREVYGKGRLNIAGAAHVVVHMDDLVHRVMQLDASWIITPDGTFSSQGKSWTRWKVSVPVSDIPAVNVPELPTRVAFLERGRTTLFNKYGSNDLQIVIATLSPAPVHGAYMTRVDANGTATVTGYIYSYFEGGIDNYLYPLSQLAVHIRYFQPGSADVGDSELDHSGGLGPTIEPLQNPTALPVRIRGTAPAHESVKVRIIDAGGREVASMSTTTPADGQIDMTWDRDTDRGARVLAGVYWVNLSTQSGIATKRLVVLR